MCPAAIVPACVPVCFRSSKDIQDQVGHSTFRVTFCVASILEIDSVELNEVKEFEEMRVFASGEDEHADASVENRVANGTKHFFYQ